MFLIDINYICHIEEISDDSSVSAG
jgi:hypothetical protein